MQLELYTGWPQKWHTVFMAITLSILSITIHNELAALKQVTEIGLFTDFAVVVEMVSEICKSKASGYNLHAYLTSTDFRDHHCRLTC